MENILITILIIGASTGFVTWCLGLVHLLKTLYENYQGWDTIELTTSEQHFFEEAIKKDRPRTFVMLDQITKKRSSSWSSYKYNKITKKLRIR